MPTITRVANGSHTGALAALLGTAIELDRVRQSTWGDLGAELNPTVEVDRTSTFTIAHSTDTLVPWQSFEIDDDAMWDPGAPDRLTIRTPGVWVFVAQLRYPSNGTGSRACKIMAYGSDVFVDSIAAGKEPGTTDAEGVTIQMTSRLARFPMGCPIFLNVWQNSGASMTLPLDYGGIYLTGTWLCP